jgi:hypothetical protein
MRWAMLLMMVCGCEQLGAGRTAEVEQFVAGTFETARPGGAVGTAVYGKGIWYRSTVFSGECLEEKHIGHREQSGRQRSGRKVGAGIRISPKYENQNDWTHSTEDGYCVYLGEDLSMDIQKVTRMGSEWLVDVTYSIREAGTWWPCVKGATGEQIRVTESPDGGFQLVGDGHLLDNGSCPQPLTAPARSRAGGKAPRAPAKRAPKTADAAAVFSALNDALSQHDHEAALEQIACYNLFEEKPFGACSGGELLDVGPVSNAPNPRDGTPWTMNVFQDLTPIGPVKQDRNNPSWHHVRVKAAAGKYKARHVTLQWVDDAWRVVGVVQRKSEGLTRIEFVNDLDRKEKREIFDRRMDGEKIGADGHPIDPLAEEIEE